MQVGDSIALDSIHTDQHFTKPPPRYSEASLVKVLVEYGIGRPSTYASIIQTLQNRQYVALERLRFYPYVFGRAVSRFLSTNFSQSVYYEFTARMEGELD